jgi:hypothetical protein
VNVWLMLYITRFRKVGEAFCEGIEKPVSIRIRYQAVLRKKSCPEQGIFQEADKDEKTSSYLIFVERRTGFDRFHLWQRYLLYICAPLLAW